MRILLYGGSGFLGLNLAYFFSDLDNEIIIVSRTKPALERHDVIWIDWDAFHSDPEEVIQEVDVLFYLVGRALPRQQNFSFASVCQAEVDEVNFLFRAIRACGAKLKFVYLSSGGAVYGNSMGDSFCETDKLNPITDYGRLKLTGEKVVSSRAREGGTSFLILRPSNIYGRYQSPQKQQGVISIFQDLIKRSKSVEVFGSGDCKKDYIYIDDFLVAVHGLLYSNAAGIFNIGSGFEASVNEIISILESELKVKVNKKYTDLDVPDVSSLSLDCKKLDAATGFSATFDLISGIRSYLKSIL